MDLRHERLCESDFGKVSFTNNRLEINTAFFSSTYFPYSDRTPYSTLFYVMSTKHSIVQLVFRKVTLLFLLSFLPSSKDLKIYVNFVINRGS